MQKEKSTAKNEADSKTLPVAGRGVKKLLPKAPRFQSDHHILIILAIEAVAPGQGREAPPSPKP